MTQPDRPGDDTPEQPGEPVQPHLPARSAVAGAARQIAKIAVGQLLAYLLKDVFG